ncbi:Dipeptidyl-peptidase 6 [Rubripirellula lacrimiformis]|uniref:Dipeptidyl-peptidase 6 n=1 Tax=Rubripirellula lacrimiformis TaxID=1930273 RepID=A0A517N419_9BACT|nr:C40 family peptidase [Rubripirellula lacrimiformis]QDT01883.1 Dipeptidyl-peptidase 6 [Rubripirellula lacrimiformis]
MILLLLLACSFATESTPTVSELNGLLESVRQTHAPDTRIELWDVHVHEAQGTWQVRGNLSSQEAMDAVQRALQKRYPDVDNQLVLLPEDQTGSLVNALVNNSVIHLRREPSSTKELVTQALLGTPVRILKTESGKSLIQVPDGYLGWVNAAELHRVDQAELDAYRDAEKVIYTVQSGRSYSDPDVNSIPMSDLVIGNMVCKVSEESGFTQIRYPDGRLGWVDSGDLLPAVAVFHQQTMKERLVQTALKFHGIPYLWGGTSSKNIDCSGLICNVYFMNGIQLPRDANMQAQVGRELTTDFVADALQPGDLLFFGRKAAGKVKQKVSHVAMYIGDGQYIHSAGYRERVSINSMDSTQANFIESYPAIFVKAVRIVGEPHDGFRPIPENAFYKEIIGSTE